MTSLNNFQLNKIKTYLGFSVKSGKIIYGLDMLKRSKKIPYIILIDENIGSNSLKQVTLYSERNKVKIYKLPENYLNDSLKRKNIKILSLYDENLSKAIIDIID